MPEAVHSFAPCFSIWWWVTTSEAATAAAEEDKNTGNDDCREAALDFPCLDPDRLRLGPRLSEVEPLEVGQYYPISLRTGEGVGARAYTDNKDRDTFGRKSVLETLREAVELEVDGATAREVLDSSLP